MVIVGAIGIAALEIAVYLLQLWWHDDPGPKKDPRNNI